MGGSPKEEAERIATEELFPVHMSLEQAQCAEGILRAWLVQMSQNPTARMDIVTMKMCQTVEKTQNTLADFLNGIMGALAEAAAKEVEGGEDL